jgi:hypothetical protein
MPRVRATAGARPRSVDTTQLCDRIRTWSRNSATHAYHGIVACIVFAGFPIVQLIARRIHEPTNAKLIVLRHTSCVRKWVSSLCFDHARHAPIHSTFMLRVKGKRFSSSATQSTSATAAMTVRVSTNDARLQTCVRCSSPCDFQPQIETETRRYNTKSTDDSPQIRFRMQLPRSSLQTGRARYKHIEECLYTAVGRRTHKMFIPNGMTSPDKFLLKHAESHGTDTICLLSYVSKTTLSSQLASGPSIRRLGSPHEQELASTSPPNYACAGSALVSSPARRIHQRYFACRIV